MDVMEYLTTRSWHWTHNHMDLVRGHMSPEDQKVNHHIFFPFFKLKFCSYQAFSFDPRLLNWSTYIENCCYGTRKFLLKEAPSGLPAARARLKMYVYNIKYSLLF